MAKLLRRELAVYRAVAKHPRTPRVAMWCLGLAISYALLPFDLIPDFIPVVGHLDDVIVIPGLIAIALWFVPADVVRECRSACPKPQSKVPWR
jgi:uncharacterized membrane protein YkvA (DUF1232 family)